MAIYYDNLALGQWP